MAETGVSEGSLPLEASATAVAEAPPAAPEPLTPERVTSWNRYLDRYVVGFVLMLVFLAAIRPINQSQIWGLLRAGERISHGAPIATDTLSYTREGKPWVNIPWLFEVCSWQVYNLAEKSFGSDQDLSKGPVFGASALTVLNALMLMIAAAVLLGVRHRGPGLWWAAVCATIALGGFFIPSGANSVAAAIGGLGLGRTTVDSRSWAILLLAVELLLVHKAVNAGQRKALWFLPLIFLIWANVDESFAIGLVLYVVWAICKVIERAIGKGGPAKSTTLSAGEIGGVAVASILVSFANPSHVMTLTSALNEYYEPIARMFGAEVGPLTADRVGFFGKLSQNYIDRSAGVYGAASLNAAFYLAVVGLGLLSFAINWRRFSLARFVVYLLVCLIWASQRDFGSFFGLVLAAALVLNGQEWYQEVFGTEGRVGWGWKLWSDGGRAITIVALFAFLAIGITGFGSAGAEGTFGLGYDDATLDFDTAEAVRGLGLKGKVLNLSLASGDALLWRAPEYKTFIDNRRGVFPDEMRAELENLKRALAEDARDKWEPILEKWGGGEPGITSLIVSPSGLSTSGVSPLYQTLMRSPYWVPLYDGGNSVLFGRVDKPTVDQSTFETRRLDPELAVYKRGATLDEPMEPPSPTSWIDYVLRSRNLKQMRPQVLASQRWLTEGVRADRTVDPARCFMAIREARKALHGNPNDWRAYIQLHTAYSALMQSEGAILAKSLRPEQSRVAYEGFRRRQLITALNLAVRTAPPPADMEQKRQLADLNYSLANLYGLNSDLDLQRDHMEAARALVPASELTEQFEQQLDQITNAVDQIRQQIDTLTSERSLGPMQRFEIAMSQNLTGMAIDQLLAAENMNNPALIRGMLVDLYCKTGQADKAFSLIEASVAGDPAFGAQPGISAYRQGTAYFLLGFYSNAANYWEGTAINQLRYAQANMGLSVAQSMFFGEPTGSVANMLDILGTPGSPGYLGTQAEWEAEVGLCKLEAGLIESIKDERGDVLRTGAAEHFKKALTLEPNLAIRGLLEYYLEKMGETPPPQPTEGGQPQGAAPGAPAGQPNGAAPAAPAATKEETKDAKEKPPVAETPKS